MLLYHGAHTQFALHEGICLTDDASSAKRYAEEHGEVAIVDVDLVGLRVVQVEGYDKDDNWAPGDDGNEWEADVLIYDDADWSGWEHVTWRLMTPEAIDAAEVIDVSAAEDFET